MLSSADLKPKCKKPRHAKPVMRNAAGDAVKGAANGAVKGAVKGTAGEVTVHDTPLAQPVMDEARKLTPHRLTK